MIRSCTALLLLAACQPADAPTCARPPGEADSTLVVSTLTERFDAGTLTLVDLDTLEVCDGVAAASSDSVVATGPGGVVIDVGRLGHDRLRFYQAPEFAVPASEFTVGRGSNPQDVVRCGDAWWVSRLGEAELIAVDDAGRQVAAVDLGPWADADGLPEAADLVTDGTTLDVALQRLDRTTPRWDPAEAGVVLRIDCETADVIAEASAPHNPGLTAGPGDSRMIFGVEGVVRWDGSEEPTPVAILPEPTTAAAFTSTGHGVLVSVDEAGWYKVRCVDPAGDLTDLLATDAYIPDAIATDSDHVWLGARRSYADPDRSPTDMPVEAGPDAAVWQVEPIACERIGEVSTDLGPFGLAVY